MSGYQELTDEQWGRLKPLFALWEHRETGSQRQ